jgi:hypothetical protein
MLYSAEKVDGAVFSEVKLDTTVDCVSEIFTRGNF